MKKQKINVRAIKCVLVFLSMLAISSVALADDNQPLQWKQPTAEQIKQMHAVIEKSRAERKNYATKEQIEELNKDLVPVEARLSEINVESNNVDDLRRKVMNEPGVVITREVIAMGIKVHKAFRSAYFDKISTISIWGDRHHRESCVRQALKEKAYLTPISDRWLVTMASMPLADGLQRYAAAEYMNDGGFMGYTMGMGRWGGGAELIRLYGVCSGVAESEPGSD